MTLQTPLAAIETSRLLLREPAAADLAAIFEIHADPITNRFNPGGPMRSVQEAEVLLQGWLAHWRAQGYGYWAIAARQQPEQLLGFGGIMAKPIEGQTGLNLYFRFRPQAWGQGYASEMALAALALAFEQLHAPAVLAVVRPANMPSRKTLERIGMRLKGSLADVPGQAPSLLYEMGARHYANTPHTLPMPTPFGA
ncbi:RimJ/RimL family protein N-acetyltransferase [Paucibacter oligotrophus]|uniref:RimJ/RimL family protein N-acetyltransferase n=1 Tax=Roseateles oligotrophus TaxID=1769250 RepID=A0A840L3H4_9BURK|nr:GNAT family N-acetyltransferase [Roseateles oligotrophus]MBB4842371.1 RimJ/RimL family protein N-acetyltransferase [Roseateles oligotrophus]